MARPRSVSTGSTRFDKTVALDEVPFEAHRGRRGGGVRRAVRDRQDFPGSNADVREAAELCRNW
jgi:hypothetical protein